MACFLKSGDTFRVTTKEALNIHPRLPTATYKVGLNSMTGQYFLEQIESFDIKGKIYGDTNQIAARMIRTFYDRDHSTGVLLAGEKGSGKTMLAKRISMLAAQDDIPTIVINDDWHGEAFNAFLQSIEQAAVVIFDEFEKVYSGHGRQEALLTLLDGVYDSKKMYIFTCNDKWRLNSNMRNRPGRIYYMLDYRGLDETFIREYCEDNLQNKSHTNMVCASARVFRAFNFDMLKSLVEEMNRYGETPAQALRFLNARADFDASGNYHVKLEVNGNKQKVSQRSWNGNPVSSAIIVRYGKGQASTFTPEQFHHCESKSGAFVFVNKKKNHRLTLTPLKSRFEVNFDTIQNLDDDNTDTPATKSDSESELNDFQTTPDPTSGDY